eukprot:TRINITY_DN51801_c0_g1_i1.p1 TRINITY_DN51801_c0_g1~~TRINITY_DN51801_c0_g1_i1.p1  ORF type:complete len:229 (-),score=62.25 TRINITY_DN51801_c0_g1_i1:670-1296(-)
MGYEDLLIARQGQKKSSKTFKISGALLIAFVLINAVFWVSLWKLTQDLYQNLTTFAPIALPVLFGKQIASSGALLNLIYYWHAAPGIAVLPFIWTSVTIYNLYNGQWNYIRVAHIIGIVLIALNAYMVNQTYMAAISTGGQCFNQIIPDQITFCANLKSAYLAMLITLGIDIALIIAEYPVMYSAARDVAERLMLEDEKRNLGFVSPH